VGQGSNSSRKFLSKVVIFSDADIVSGKGPDYLLGLPERDHQEMCGVPFCVANDPVMQEWEPSSGFATNPNEPSECPSCPSLLSFHRTLSFYLSPELVCSGG
jgi:hypothetical protein